MVGYLWGGGLYCKFILFFFIVLFGYIRDERKKNECDVFSISPPPFAPLPLFSIPSKTVTFHRTPFPPLKAKNLDPGFIVCRTGEDKNSMMCVFFPLCPCNRPEHMEKKQSVHAFFR